MRNDPRKWMSDRKVLKRMVERCASPPDVQEAVILARRWTRLPIHAKPDIGTSYGLICGFNYGGPGFAEWLTKLVGTGMYYAFQRDFPDEAAEFRQQILAICFVTVDLLNQIDGGRTALARPYARHVQRVVQQVFGKDGFFDSPDLSWHS